MEKFLFKKVEMWFVLILAMVGIVGSLLFAGAVRSYNRNGDQRVGSLGPTIEAISSIPSKIYKIVTKGGGSADLVTEEQRFEGQSGFQFNYAAGTRPDLGYVLVNRYDGDEEYSVSELWDLNAQEKIHTWSFAEVDGVWAQSTLETTHGNISVDHAANRFRSAHALLTKDGDVYTHSFGAPIVKADSCSALSLFQDGAIYHHSLERDHAGNFWVPKRIEPKTVAIGNNTFLDDGITLISPTGEVLFEKSVVQLLDDNGLGYLIYGKGEANNDPIHLNDIQPALTDGKFWKQGDIFLSLRHQSMIVLYRPSTNTVLWHKQGPWMHEHDVDILNDHQISIFNNNAITENKSDLVVRDSNNVLVYNFQTNQVTSPWQAGFEKLELRTKTEGRGEIVGKEVFVEETNYGRLIQFLPDGTVSWQFINRATDGNVYIVSWSRLISRELGDQVRAAVSQRSCS